MVFVTRKVDSHGRIYLPEEVLPNFKKDPAYFYYDASKDMIYVISHNRMSLAILAIESEHGIARESIPSKTRDLFDRLANSFLSEPCNGERVKIPKDIREKARISGGDSVEVEVFGGNHFKFRKLAVS